MKASVMIGVILVLAGAAALIWKGIEYTTSETVVDVGPIEVEAEQEKTIPIAPIVGVVAVIGGIILIGTGRTS
jgi:hypothetical protein